MCLAIPCQVIELCDAEQAVIEVSGVRKRISLALVEDVAVGDYVIVHVGYALTRLDPEEAARTLEAFAALGDLQDALDELGGEPVTGQP